MVGWYITHKTSGLELDDDDEWSDGNGHCFDSADDAIDHADDLDIPAGAIDAVRWRTSSRSGPWVRWPESAA